MVLATSYGTTLPDCANTVWASAGASGSVFVRRFSENLKLQAVRAVAWGTPSRTLRHISPDQANSVPRPLGCWLVV